MTQSKKKLFLETISGKAYTNKPVWFMRQAGRFLKSYQTIKEKYTFLQMCTNPEIAAEITLLPLKELDVDVLILFSDILIPLLAKNGKLHYTEGKSPIASVNLEEKTDLSQLEFVSKAIKLIKSEAKDVALLGFAAAPFTLMCYTHTGGDFTKLKTMVFCETQRFKSIIEQITSLTIEYLKLQLKAGCDAVQLFDSWVGIMPQKTFKDIIAPQLKKIRDNINAPVIYFSKDSNHLLDDIAKIGFDCISVDQKINIKDAYEKYFCCMQGNLDNTLLLCSREIIKQEAENLLKETKGIPHIFNLSHGVLPQTPQENVKFLVDVVHNFS